MGEDDLRDEVPGIEAIQEQEDERPKRRGRPVAVRVVQRSGESALVEWAEGASLRRGYVPIGEVEDGQCHKDTLKEAIPYGVDWASLLEFGAFDAEAISDDLHRKGIWTVSDLETKVSTAVAAINRAAGLTVASLRRAAQRQEEE